jgi:hypothetical protein
MRLDRIQLVRGELLRCKATTKALSFNGGVIAHARDLVEALLAA